MSEETKTEEEPSIEEILDSIRQIISDDDDEDSDMGGNEPVEESSSDEPLDQSAIDDIDFDTPAPAAPDEPLDQSAIDDIDFDSPAAEPEPEEKADEPEDDVLELTDRVDPEGAIDVDMQDEEVIPDPVPEVKAAPVVESVPDEDSDIFTNRVEIAAADAISKLVKKTAVEHNGITLEDIVRTELKPLLRAWLDRNLPTLIERLVAEELERVSKRILED
ncbi:MAG: DUF2497 domain-containing protein [Alphaproteobacteria bacterium]